MSKHDQPVTRNELNSILKAEFKSFSEEFRKVIRKDIEEIVGGAVQEILRAMSEEFAIRDKRFSQHDKRFDALDTRLDRISSKLDAAVDWIGEQEVRIRQLEIKPA